MLICIFKAIKLYKAVNQAMKTIRVEKTHSL